MPMQTVIYGRVSTDDQAKRGLSIPAQLEACRAYAAAQGWSVGLELTDDETGAILARPNIERLRELIASGAVARVLVLRQDRLARDELTYFTLRREFKRHKVELHAVNRGKMDGLYASLEAVLDADERERIRERTDRGRRLKAERGILIGAGPPPFGYVRIGEKDSIAWEPDPTAAPVVFRIFSLYTTDLLSPAQIAERLTAEAVPSPSDRRPEVKRKRGPATWGRETVRWILRHPAYAGTHYAYRQQQGKGDQPRKRPPVRLRPASEWIPVSVPALVPREMWERAQQILREAGALAFRNTKRPYLVARRIRCQCGAAMTARTSSLSAKNTRQYPYYTCNRRRGELAEGVCTAPHVRADGVDDAVWAWVRATFFDPETLTKRLKERDERRRQQATPATRRAELDADIAEFDDQIARINQAWVAGAYASVDEYLALKRPLDTRRALREQERALLPRDSTATDAPAIAILEELSKYRKILDRAPFELMRLIVDQLQIAVIVRRDEAGPRLDVRSALFDIGQELLIV
jgi:site-specific DNA recombinase